MTASSAFGTLLARFGIQNTKHSNFLGWEDYTERMAVLELHAWQQQTRIKSLANASCL